jgi:hypothetical protein
MNDKTYNGWANYATWSVNMNFFDGLPIDYFGINLKGEDRWEDIKYAAECLEEMVDNELEYKAKGIALEFARSFVSNTDWLEIAEHLVDAWVEETHHNYDAQEQEV